MKQIIIQYIIGTVGYIIILSIKINYYNHQIVSGFELVETGSVDYELEKAVIININNSAIIVKCENVIINYFYRTIDLTDIF